MLSLVPLSANPPISRPAQSAAALRLGLRWAGLSGSGGKDGSRPLTALCAASHHSSRYA
jgi:hypothetical protein